LHQVVKLESMGQNKVKLVPIARGRTQQNNKHLLLVHETIIVPIIRVKYAFDIRIMHVRHILPMELPLLKEV